MKGLRSRYICFLMIVSLSSLLSGCNGIWPEKREPAAQQTGSAGSASGNERISIRFAQWSVPSAKLVEETVDRYNKTNKDNIRVEPVKIPLDKYVETINMLNASGEGPDVFEAMREWLNSYILKEWVADLSPFIEDSFLRSFPAWAVNLASDPIYKGKFYTLPSNQITYRLIYNKDLFRMSGLDPEAPPKTLPELVKYAKAISDHGKGERKYGFALPMGAEWMGFVQPMEAASCYSGLYYYNFKDGKYDLTVYRSWITAYKTMNENGGLFPGMASMKEDHAMAQFAEGNIGMMFAASWKLSLFYEQYPPKCELGVSLPPAIDEASAGKGAVAISPAGWNVVNSGTKHRNEAAKVWKFLYSRDYLGDLFRHGSAIPVADSITKDAAYMPSAANFITFLPGGNDAVYPNTPQMMEEWARIKAYTAAVTGDQTDNVLLRENARLNSLLNNAAPVYGLPVRN